MNLSSTLFFGKESSTDEIRINYTSIRLTVGKVLTFQSRSNLKQIFPFHGTISLSQTFHFGRHDSKTDRIGARAGLWDTALKFLSPGPRNDVADHLE